MCFRLTSAAVLISVSTFAMALVAQTGPSLVDSNLRVRTTVDNLSLPTAMAFLSPQELLVLEKNTGRVWHVRTQNGARTLALDLSVNFASERGLLGIAVHPQFATNHFVYLFWTCASSAPPPASNPFYPTETRCAEQPALGADVADILQVPLLGNRIDRFTFNPTASTLTFSQNLIMFRAFQNDAAPEPPNQNDSTQPARGNHDSGVLAFGPDGKLYAILGDMGRRGWLQNLKFGPTTGTTLVPDDQFGGPEPDNAHFTGVILRLNDDGSAPSTNPFYSLGASTGGEVGENLKKIWVYGIRNSFGMAFDPLSGNLWYQSNGEDAYDEISRAVAGMNEGWIQFQGPASRLADYRFIETTSLHHETVPSLQQDRWPPDFIATTAAEAFSRLVMFPGARYVDPEFSWKHVVAPAGLGFLNSSALGPQYYGDMFVGVSEDQPLEGVLMRFRLTGNRRKFGFDSIELQDRVCDNPTYHVLTNCEEILFGSNFGAITDVKTAPNGNLWVVSLTHGRIYEIYRR